MTEAELKAKIEAAFSDTPSPGGNFDDISGTQWDEGIVDYFRGTTWRGHRVIDLRHHSAALSFFTYRAFRYWVPAFMLAELENPEEADIIKESIASNFLPGEYHSAETTLAQFAPAELDAIAAFMDHCSRIYNPTELGIHDSFAQAAKAVRDRLALLRSHRET
jgi:hypothetical protein